MDPLAEKYNSWSPYNYAVNNPILFIDPDGKDITIHYKSRDEDGNEVDNTFVFNGTNASDAPDNPFVAYFIQAYRYNIENGGGDNLLEAATNSDLNIELMSRNDNAFNRDENTVFWNPLQAVKFSNGNTISAATALEHEFDHAVSFNNDSKTYLERRGTIDKDYRNREERRVIRGSETKTAIANGEIQGGFTRENYGTGLTRYIPTSYPITTVPRPPFPWNVYDYKSIKR